MSYHGVPVLSPSVGIDQARAGGVDDARRAFWYGRVVRVHDVENGTGLAEVKYNGVRHTRCSTATGRSSRTMPGAELTSICPWSRTSERWIIGNVVRLWRADARSVRIVAFCRDCYWCSQCRCAPADAAMAARCGAAYDCQQPNTEGDQDNGSVVTEGVQFPGVDHNSPIGHATAQNATCTDCQWTVSPACLANGPNDDALCMMAVSSCPRPGDPDARVPAARHRAVAADRHDLPGARSAAHPGGGRRVRSSGSEWSTTCPTRLRRSNRRRAAW